MCSTEPVQNHLVLDKLNRAEIDKENQAFAEATSEGFLDKL